MLQQTAELEDPSSQEASPVQEARVCESKPRLTRGYQTGCVPAVHSYVPAEFKYCGNSSLQRPPNSNETPAYLHETT